jgi:hypothetical protein
VTAGWLFPKPPSCAADVTLGKNGVKHDQKIEVESCETAWQLAP